MRGVKWSRGPAPSQFDHDRNRRFEVLPRRPFEARVEVVLAGEQVRRRQPHERQARAIGAATNRLLDRRQSSGADRLARTLDHLRKTIAPLALFSALLF